MRKKRWIAPVWGMLATAAFGQAASAQAPGSPLDGPFPPAGPPMAPPPGQYAGNPTYTPIAPDAASPAGYPPGDMRPWPTISPYDNAFDQTYNQNGIWFREMLGHNRKYKIEAEFLSARFRQPGHATIGSEAAIGTFVNTQGEPEIFEDLDTRNGIDPSDIFVVKDAISIGDRGTYYRENDGSLGDRAAQVGPLPRPITSATTVINQGAPGTDDFVFDRVKGGILQGVNVDISDGLDDSDGAVVAGDEVSDTFLYPVTGQVLGLDAVTRFGGQDDVVGERMENSRSPGMRLTFGLEDEDESGVDWSGYWINGDATVFSRGLDDPDRPRLTNVVFFEASHLGEGAAEMLDYNTLFRIKNETETAGTDLAFYHTPMVDYGWFRMRPIYGARYDYIREHFQFTGRDNGTAYAFDWEGDVVDTEENPPQNVVSSNVVPLTVDAPIFTTTLLPYETTVDSKVRSHLYGPEIGFDASAGGEYLMLTAIAKTGVLANTEKLTLDTAGFGSQEALTGVRSFRSDAKTHTRVAPFLDMNLNADINVFPIIPVVNRWNWLKNARVRTGWNTFVVGNIQRPIDQIVWRSDGSGGAYIKEKGRDAWYVNSWDVGLHWTF